jgi:hypothetical protein
MDSYIQTLKTNLLKSIIEKNKQDKQAAIKESGTKQNNVISQANNTVKEATDKNANSSTDYPSCKPLITNYQKYDSVDTPTTTKSKYKDAIGAIIAQTSDQKLRYLVFAAIYLGSSNGSELETKENNYSGVDLLQNWGQAGDSYFNKQYYCISSNVPYSIFSDLSKHVEFLIARWKDRTKQLPEITSKEITKFYTLYFSANAKNIDVYNKLVQQNASFLSEMEVSVQKSIDLFKTGSGNVSGTLPPNTPPQGQTNQVIFENSFAFSTYYLQNLKINSGGALTGDFLVLNNGALLTQDYNAKIYLASQMSDILIANFTIKEKTNRGSFVSSPNFIEALELARDRNTYEVGFRVRVDAFPNIVFGNKDFVKVVMPLDCPEEGLKYREIVGTYDWEAIKDNICCYCFGKPYTGMQIVWDGKPCSRNGTTC